VPKTGLFYITLVI